MKNHKMNPQIIRHGEVILKPVELPKEAVLVKEAKEYIVAHSETGHHHVLKTETKKPFGIYSYNGKTYLGVIEDALLVHAKTGQDVHAPHKIVPAYYEVVIKKSFNYFTRALEKVRD
jgi:hypothetical protein